MLKVVSLLTTLLLLQQSAMADYMFSLELPTYNSSLAGTTVNQDLFLVATTPNELVSAGTTQFNLNAASGAGNTKITGFTRDTAFGTNLAGSISNHTVTANGVEVRLYTNAAPAASNRVRLGSVQFQLGNAGSATALTFVDPGPLPGTPSGNNVVARVPGVPPNDRTEVLDSFVFSPANSSFSANVAAVPEPSSFALLTLGVLGMASRRRRRPAA